MNELLKKYKEYKDTISKYCYAIFVINFDEQTDCPKDAKAYSNEVCQFFENKYYDITLSDDYIKLIYALHEDKNLDEITKLDIDIEYKELEKVRKIPRDELIAHIKNMDASNLAWHVARETMDFKPFYKELKEILAYNKKYIKWQETDTIKGYDVLLNDMEEGYNQKLYDEFFEHIEKELVPFVKEIINKPQKYNPILDTLKFDIDKQKKLTALLAEKMEYTNKRGCIRETIHPFTNWASNLDVRVTTNYHEELLFSNLYSIMHEIGHALFQLQMDDKYNNTNIFDNVTCITHESQSRFYENYLGRRRSFIHFLYPELLKLFPEELKDITEDDIFYYANAAKSQYTRVEADELTYPIHILIRYKVEKDLFNNVIDETGMEQAFNKYMNEYLGITPHDLKEGVFQDGHWASGFGYFPTYAVGSAYGAMFLEAMQKDMDIDKDLSVGNFKNINMWLREHIHQFSGTRKNLEVVRYACGKEFDVNIYIKYLKDKFSEIYK